MDADLPTVVSQTDERQRLWHELFELDMELWELQRRMKAYCYPYGFNPFEESPYEMMLDGRFDWNSSWDELVTAHERLCGQRTDLEQKLAVQRVSSS